MLAKAPTSLRCSGTGVDIEGTTSSTHHPSLQPIPQAHLPQSNQPRTSLRGGTEATPSSAALLARFAAVPRPGLALPSPSCPRYRGDPRLNLKVGGNRMGASCQPAKAAPLRMACSSWSLASRDSSSPGGGVEERMASECRRRTELCYSLGKRML